MDSDGLLHALHQLASSPSLNVDVRGECGRVVEAIQSEGVVAMTTTKKRKKSKHRKKRVPLE